MEFLITVILRFQLRNRLLLNYFSMDGCFDDGYVTQLDFLEKSASSFFHGTSEFCGFIGKIFGKN